LPHWQRVSVSRCRCMPQGNSGLFTQCVLRCRTRKLSGTAIVTAKLGLIWWIEFRCGSLSAETYPRINLTDWCRSPRDVRFTACWFRRCRFKQRAAIPPLTLPEADAAGQLAHSAPTSVSINAVDCARILGPHGVVRLRRSLQRSTADAVGRCGPCNFVRDPVIVRSSYRLIGTYRSIPSYYRLAFLRLVRLLGV
jgi:hypothetical protein